MIGKKAKTFDGKEFIILDKIIECIKGKITPYSEEQFINRTVYLCQYLENKQANLFTILPTNIVDLDYDKH